MAGAPALRPMAIAPPAVAPRTMRSALPFANNPTSQCRRSLPSTQDWNDGRIPYFTLPPKRDSEVAGSAQLVAEWGPDFDADQAATLAGLVRRACLPCVATPAAPAGAQAGGRAVPSACRTLACARPARCP